jgi:hypothetical protein
MTDLPPRTTPPPPRVDERPIPSISRPQTGMWIAVAVLAAVILLAVVFTLNRSGSASDQTTTEPVVNDPIPTEPDTSDLAPTATEVDPGTSTDTGTAPATGSGDTPTSP